MPARTPWSPMRRWSFGLSLACGGLAVAAYLSSLAYTRGFDPGAEFWMLAFIGVASFAAFVGAIVRDQIIDAVRANAQALEDLPLHIADYGDRREIAGHQLVRRVDDTHRRRGLNPVD